jgi:hypothetical protein
MFFGVSQRGLWLWRPNVVLLLIGEEEEKGEQWQLFNDHMEEMKGAVTPCLSLVYSLRLKMTGVSITPTKCTPWCLGHHWSLSLWFHKWFYATVFRPFCQAVGVQVDPTLKLISVCKFLPDSRHAPDPGFKRVITHTFVSLRPKKWFNDRSLFT